MIHANNDKLRLAIGYKKVHPLVEMYNILYEQAWVRPIPMLHK